MRAIDINCDMGESTSFCKYSMDNDIGLFPYISSINLACGFHAGDAHTMHELVDAALTAGISIGAHPGYADKENFGRTNQHLSPSQVYDIVLYQVGALDAFLKIHGTKLQHVKPHGALYNMAAKDAVLAEAICHAVKDFDKGLLLFGLSGSELIHAASRIDLASCSEVFADRTYQDDGSLTARTENNALIETNEGTIQQLLQIVTEQVVTSVSGKKVPIFANTICIHGDGKHAMAFAKVIHSALTQQQISITAPQLIIEK